jgi:hypothetical protein
VYDWTKKMFGPKTSEIGQNVEAQNEKGCGDDYDNYYRFFTCRESSWKGENETIECLKKVMSKVSEYVYLVVVGYVQSGKSQLMIYYSAWMAKEHNMNIIIMLRNQTVDVESLSRKIMKFKKERKLTNADIEVISFAKQFTISGLEDIHQKFCETKKIFIILGNSDQLGKINQIINYGNENEIPIKPFCLVIDELDLNEKQEATKFYTEFNKIKGSGFISSVLGVTATALPVMFRRVQELKSDQIIRLQAPLNYKGINNIDFTTIDIKEIDINKKVMIRLLKTKYNSFKDKDGNIHPTILLIKDERIKTNQLEMRDHLLFDPKIKKHYCMLVWNGDGMYIDLPDRTTIFAKNLNINDALQNIKDLKYGKVPERIAIISGDLANRGQSFVSTDYSWHLTHMIMSASNGSSGTNLIQYTRLCGCYNDDIHLNLFTSDEIQKELYAYDYYQNQIVEECGEIVDQQELKVMLTKMKLKKECVMVRPIDNRIKLKYQRISNFNKKLYGEKIEAKNRKEAIKKAKKDYEIIEDIRVYVKEIITKKNYNEENIKNAKKTLKKDGFKHVNVIRPEKSYLYKNPEFVEKKRENFDAMIINKNGKIAYYYKDDDTELEYGEWFIFESPQGFFLAKSGKDKSELMDTFHEHYKIRI